MQPILDDQTLNAQAEDARLGMATRFGTSLENVSFDIERTEKDILVMFHADRIGYQVVVGDWQWEEYRTLGERVRLHSKIGRGVSLLHTNEVYDALGTRPEDLGHAMCMVALKRVFGGEVRLDLQYKQTYLWLPPFNVTAGNIYADGFFTQSAIFDPLWSINQSNFTYDVAKIEWLVEYLRKNLSIT